MVYSPFIPPHIAIGVTPETIQLSGSNILRPVGPGPRPVRPSVTAQPAFPDWIRNESSQILIRIKHVGIQNGLPISPILMAPSDFEQKRELYGSDLKNDMIDALVLPLDQEVRTSWLERLRIASTADNDVSGAYGECQVKLRSPTKTWDDIFPKSVIIGLINYIIEIAPTVDGVTIHRLKVFRAQISR